MAYDILRGRTPRNHAIQGHPPWGSPEYAFVRGVSPAELYRQHTREAEPSRTTGDEVGFIKIYSISPTDYDAASHWMANFAENVNYTRRVHKDKILSAEDATEFAELWKRWLLFQNKVAHPETERTVTIPGRGEVPIAPRTATVIADVLKSLAATGLMDEESKQEFDSILTRAFKLFRKFKLQGLSQVAVPYMGELVELLRSLPPSLTLTDMVKMLRDGARAGERLLDKNTAWWQWKYREETSGLREAIRECGKVADEIERVSKKPEGAGPREKDTPVYERVTRAITRVYVEAAGLYGIEETKTTARAEAREEMADRGEETTSWLLWLLAAAGVGYLGAQWFKRPQIVVIGATPETGYQPDDQSSENEEYDEEYNEEGEHHGTRF